MMRLSRSRPSWSVPSGYSQLGRSNVWVWSLAVGLRGASTSAKIATASSTATMATPTSAAVLRRSRRIACTNGDSARSPRPGATIPTGRSASLMEPPLIVRCFTVSPSFTLDMVSSRVSNAWIQERIAQVDQQIDHNERERGDEREALHLLVVTGDDGVDSEGAKSRHGEQGLHDDRAADEEADLEPHHGHGRDQGILERVLQHDGPLAQALGPSGRDVLRPDDLEHARTKQPRQKSGPPDAERERGHEDMLNVAPDTHTAQHRRARAWQIPPPRAGE